MYKDRHERTQINCEMCGTPHLVRVERIKKGQGRFCSRKCANDFQKLDAQFSYGKEKGKKYWDGKRWWIHWKDETGKTHNQSYARWWWEINKGQVPNGYDISYIDGNFANLDPSNFECIPSGQAKGKGGHKTLGYARPDIAGDKNKWWKGTRTYEYPLKFSKSLKRRMKIRDGYTCQCCYTQFPTHQLDVHHIDKNPENNDETNLVTLCKSCHRAVHGKENKINDKIVYYRSLLPD